MRLAGRMTMIRVAVVLAVALGVTAAMALDQRGDLTPEDRARVVTVTAPATDFARPEPFEAMPAGAATSLQRVDRESFSHISANQTFEAEDRFRRGKALFRKFWVASAAEPLEGLAPLFNARACQSCHLDDGRGRPPPAGEDAVSMFLRLSVPPRSEEERRKLADRELARIPEPTYGGQLQNFAARGQKPEGRMAIDYAEEPVTLADGTIVSLRRPTYRVEDLGYGPLDPDVMLSPRVAPPMIGLGLIEQIAPADIRALADPEDADGDGISGNASFARDPETGAIVLARFGWKATAPTIRAQTAEAFSGDIGLSMPLVAEGGGECPTVQQACRNAQSGAPPRLGGVETPGDILDLVTFYSRNLAVPARRNVGDPTVLKGKQLFYGAGCIACHTPKFVTSRKAPDKTQRFQLIWPYSDFLLHDMGEGLADGGPVGDADGREWRTPPLWGIGLTETVSGHAFFLHDGRARNFAEAILWHGGEGQAARDAYAAMAKADRDALHAFLASL